MGEIVERNAVIESADLVFERDALTPSISFDYGGAGQQCLGAFVLMVSLDSPHRDSTERGPNYAGLLIDRIMRVAGVERWQDLPGRPVRVLQEHSEIHAVGHIIKDTWFYPKAQFARLSSPEPTQ